MTATGGSITPQAHRIMAIVKISNELCDDREFMSVFNKSFDVIKELEPTKSSFIKGEIFRVFYVKNDEVPDDETQIAFNVSEFEGVEPFITEYYV